LEKKNEEFSTFDAMRICDIEQSRFYHWMNDVYIPEGELVKWGRGYKTVFSLYDLYSISLFKECVDFSLSREVSKRYMNFVNWAVIFKNNYRFMVILCTKELVKKKDGKYKIKTKEEPLFLEDLKELAFVMEIAAQTIAEEIEPVAYPKQMEEQEIPVLMEELSGPQQPHIGFFVDLERILENVEINL